MNAAVPERLLPVFEELNQWFESRFDRLVNLGTNFMSVLSIDDEQHLEITDASRRRMKPIATRYLADNSVVDGCGLIFAHSALGTENGHLEWWVREDESRFARYSFGVVPGADRYYDYEHHEWFTRAFHDGVPAIVGPYIDYLGVESYVMTLTVPAEFDGVRLGAVGNDIQLADLETALLPILIARNEPLAVLGMHGHVICSNTEQFLVGDHVPADLRGYERAEVIPAGAGITLLFTSAHQPA